MTTLTRDTIRKVLGPVDETLMAGIIGTGASERELIEARGWLSADETLHDELRTFPTGRVAALVELIGEHEAAPDERL